MALSPTVLASLIKASLVSSGANGSNLEAFCTALGAGIVMSIVGTPFVTVDVGLVPGVGAGIGTGLTGLSASSMASLALAQMVTTGSNASPLMQAIMGGVVAHLSESASLVSTDSPVFQGAGTITAGSIAVVAEEMASNIDSQLQSAGAQGSNRMALATAIAAGICGNILSAGSGTLVITGVFTGPTPPGPIPGAGAGSGVIS